MKKVIIVVGIALLFVAGCRPSFKDLDGIVKYYARGPQVTFPAFFETLWGERTDAKGIVFPVSRNNVPAVLDAVRDLAEGRLAFRVEQNFGLGNKADRVAVVEESDQLKLLEIMNIQGNDFEISNKSIVAHFREWAKHFRYRITGVGLDFIEAEFLDPPRDMAALAAEIYAMCPDVVEQGTGSVEELASEMKRTNSMYFWWD